MVWKQMKYCWRDFKVMAADKIEQSVERVSNQFGKEYIFTFKDNLRIRLFYLFFTLTNPNPV